MNKLDSGLLRDVAVLELQLDGTQFSPSAAYCGTLLQLLGAQVARAQVCLIDAKRGGFASVEDRELEAVLAFDKRTVSGTWVAEELSKHCGNVDVVLLSGDGSVTSEHLQRLIGEVHASLHPKVVACITSFGLSGPNPTGEAAIWLPFRRRLGVLHARLVPGP